MFINKYNTRQGKIIPSLIRTLFKRKNLINKIKIMKQLSAIVICLFTALTIYAQQYSNDVTITVNGSKNLQIAVDGRNYDLTNSTVKGEKITIAINNLDVGQHSLQVTRN